jgi:hypothetical protein
MAAQDNCVSLHPYMKVKPGQMEAFREVCARSIEITKKESKCLYYGYTFSGDEALCREGYEGAEGVLAHLENIGPLLPEFFKHTDMTRFEVHGPAEELAKLKQPLASMNIQFFTLEYGFRAPAKGGSAQSR